MTALRRSKRMVKHLTAKLEKAAKKDRIHHFFNNELYDLTDFKITLDSLFRYRHAVIEISLYGYTFWIDTKKGTVSNGNFYHFVSYDVSDAIDDYFEELYTVSR